MDPANVPKLNYTVDITHDYSMAWVANEDGKHRDDSKPFFLYESFTVPHAGGWGWQGSPGGLLRSIIPTHALHRRGKVGRDGEAVLFIIRDNISR